MPPVSEAQRRAMRAAAAGHSTLGIPAKVGREFDKADPGGKLPKKIKARKVTASSKPRNRTADYSEGNPSQRIGSSKPASPRVRKR